MHVAKHMEEIALAVLPRDTEFEDDRVSLSSKSSISSKSDRPQQQEPETATASAAASALEAFEGKRPAKLEDLNFLYTIGRGVSSKTLLAEGKISRRLYAVKIVKKELAIENDEVAQIKAQKEALLFVARENHPFIVRMRSTFQTETRVYFVLDYMSGGNLMFHIQKGMQIGEEDSISLLQSALTWPCNGRSLLVV